MKYFYRKCLFFPEVFLCEILVCKQENLLLARSLFDTVVLLTLHEVKLQINHHSTGFMLDPVRAIEARWDPVRVIEAQ